MKENLAEVWAKLRQEHDELRVKMHLGTMEAKEEWDELEKKWQRFESKAAEAKDQVVETSREVSEGVELIAKELGAAYHRIRDGLRESWRPAAPSQRWVVVRQYASPDTGACLHIGGAVLYDLNACRVGSMSKRVQCLPGPNPW